MKGGSGRLTRAAQSMAVAPVGGEVVQEGCALCESGQILKRAASGAGAGPFPQLWHQHSPAD